MPAKPLYARVMGDSWTEIAEPIGALHATRSITRARGHLRIEHGRHFLARLLARVLRLPQPGAAAETQLIVTAHAGGERWERTFNGLRLATWQYESDDTALAERFGVLELRFRLDASGGSLLYVQREAALRFGLVRLRLPDGWAPRVEAREDPAGAQQVKVDVRVSLPGVGLLIAYDGIIHVEDTRA